MSIEVVIIILYLAVVLFIIGFFIVKDSMQRQEIKDRIDKLEEDQGKYPRNRYNQDRYLKQR